MTDIKSYQDLVAWQKGMDLVVVVYRESSKLPTIEEFGLKSQVRRCSVSIPSNIAEGWGRQSTQDYLRFLSIARGAVYELLTQAEICDRLDFDGAWREIVSAAREVGRILHGLIVSTQRSVSSCQP